MDFFRSFQVLKSLKNTHFNTSDGLFLGRFTAIRRNTVRNPYLSDCTVNASIEGVAKKGRIV